MLINIEAGNDAGTRVDKEQQTKSFELEDIFAELAQIIHWAKKNGSDKITLVVSEFKDRVN